MNREQFKDFVAETIDNLIRFAEESTGHRLPRKYCFRWLFTPTLIYEDIAEVITLAVYQDEKHIRSCVDIGVSDFLDDGTLIVEASISGHAPAPFGKNWTVRDGPFIYVVGQSLIDKIAKLKESLRESNNNTIVRD